MHYWTTATACGLLWIALVICAPREDRTNPHAWPRMRRTWRRMVWIAYAAFLSTGTGEAWTLDASDYHDEGSHA